MKLLVSIVGVGLISIPKLTLGFTLPSSTCKSSSSKVTCHAKRRGRSGGFDPSSDRGRGFQNSRSKTYGSSARAPLKDLIDIEGAMQEFFSTNAEWSPLFSTIAQHESVPAMSFLDNSQDFELDHDSTFPWKRLAAKPESKEEMAVVAIFLDAMQQALIDIPVNEGVKEDADDLNFLEEGRRMLCVSRFQVLQGVKGGSVDNFDALFSTCWSEIAELHSANEKDTGSLILLPNYDLSDLRRFTDMNLQRPLDWLGMSTTFEVASMQREYPAIRLLHKLSDMPKEPWNHGKPVS